jgi:NitT/TauT family transport system permease protein
MWNIAVSGILLENLSHTLLRILIGFLFGASAGIAIGILLGYFRKIFEPIEPLIDFFRSIPLTSLFPLFLLFFGIGEGAKIFIIFWGCALIIVVNTAYGVINCCRIRVMVFNSMQAGKIQILSKLILFEALPEIFSGLRISLAISLITVVVTEMFTGTTYGLGLGIYNSSLIGDVPEMYAWIIITGLLGYLLNRVFLLIEGRLLHWVGR